MTDSNSLRCAILIDFDNVISGLRDGAGAEIAIRFAEQPQVWLDRLMEDAPRRVLLRRCYMNPGGYVEESEGGPRRYFNSFRWAFQAAGFEVMDCPLLTRMKNAADLRIALDAMDLVTWPTTRIDEFTLALHRLGFCPASLAASCRRQAHTPRRAP